LVPCVTAATMPYYPESTNIFLPQELASAALAPEHRSWVVASFLCGGRMVSGGGEPGAICYGRLLGAQKGFVLGRLASFSA
jgi:hypothetical protein